jgi:hypothetical protein
MRFLPNIWREFCGFIAFLFTSFVKILEGGSIFTPLYQAFTLFSLIRCQMHPESKIPLAHNSLSDPNKTNYSPGSPSDL